MISGTVIGSEAPVGATVSLYDNGGATAITTATVGPGGTWSAPVTLSGDGTHSIVAKDTDAVGNTGSSTAVVFTLDTIPPTVSIATSGGVTNRASQTISGTVIGSEAPVGATVSLYDNGGVTAIATVGASGSWSAPVTLSGDGTHSIVAKDTDAAGNTGSSSGVVFTLDTDSSEQAALALSFIDTTILTAQAKLVHFSVSGLGPEDSAVVAFTDSQGGTPTVTANGTATVDLSGLSDGTITASMQVATDAAGNSFLPVAASNTGLLDQDKGEQAALSLAFVDTTILTAQSKLVHFSVSGLDPEDSAVVTFTDSLGGKTTATVTANGLSAPLALRRPDRTSRCCWLRPEGSCCRPGPSRPASKP